jgi:hypothetical protein
MLMDSQAPQEIVMANGFQIIVVPRLHGDWRLRSGDHAVTVVAAEDWPDLPPFDPPDVAALEEFLARQPDRPLRVRIEGGVLDLERYAEHVAAARERDLPIEFHLV